MVAFYAPASVVRNTRIQTRLSADRQGSVSPAQARISTRMTFPRIRTRIFSPGVMLTVTRATRDFYRGNPLALALTAAILARLVLMSVFAAQGEAAFLRSNDSSLYLTAAFNLKTYGIFSEQPGSPPPPTMLHLPGYPLFLAVATAAVAASWFTVALQHALSLMTVVILFQLVAEAWDRRLAFWAALGYGVEPFTVYQANLLMSDTLFVFLLMLGLHWYLRALRRQSVRWLVGSAVVFGLSVYVRSVGLYVVGLLTAWWIFAACRSRAGWRLTAAGLALAVIVGSMLAPWVARNGRALGVWKLSTLPNFVLLLYHANHALALREGISPPAARGRLIAEMEARTNDVASRDAFMGRRAREILRQEWRSYLPVYLVKIAPFFLQSGWRDVAEASGFSSRARPLDLTTALVRRQWGSIAAALRPTDAPSWAHLVGTGFYLALTVLALAGAVGPRRGPKPQRAVGWLLAALVAAVALLSSPLSHARYRQPVQPLLFALAAVAVVGRSSASAAAQDGANRAQ